MAYDFMPYEFETAMANPAAFQTPAAQNVPTYLSPGYTGAGPSTATTVGQGTGFLAGASALLGSNPVTLPLAVASLGLQAFGMFESDRKAKRQRKREQAQQAEYQKQLAWQNLIRVAQGGSPQTAGYQPAPSGGDSGQTLQTLGGALGNFTTNLYAMEQNRASQKQNEDQMALKQREQSAEEAWRQKQSEDAWKIEQFRQQQETERANIKADASLEKGFQMTPAVAARLYASDRFDNLPPETQAEVFRVMGITPPSQTAKEPSKAAKAVDWLKGKIGFGTSENEVMPDDYEKYFVR